MSSDVIGQLVTPQNSEIIPTAAHSDGSKPVRLPNRHPKVAPMKKDGTISPPLKPAPRVSAVKMIFSRNASAGSGKSSLAFDTIYAEGQRRYMESLSSYARMFLGQMEKPDVEKIEGLSPAISIDQKSTNRNPRSTVGTVTEIYDYFRLLYARIGIPHCPNCGRPIARQTVDQMVDQILALPEGTKIQLLAPVVRGRKGEHAKVLERAKRSGYVSF